MTRKALYFEGPHQVSIRKEQIPAGEPGQVLVETSYSAISAGTELLFYRGQIPEGIPADSSLGSLQQETGFPIKYGYQTVGQIVDVKGASVDLIDKKVFAFQPHQSHYWTHPADLVFLPEGLSLEDAVFLPSMETSVSFLHDGQPLLGERVAIFGQGVVGLLTTALLSQLPLEKLITFDTYLKRRNASTEMGADASFQPADIGVARKVFETVSSKIAKGADLIYEISGNPQALDQAIGLAGFDSRLVIGSWYGTKPSKVHFGEDFHRDRVRIISSQVSTIRPSLTGRWSKARRLSSALARLMKVQPSRLISHRMSIDQADEAYKLIDSTPGEVLQVIFTYGSDKS